MVHACLIPGPPHRSGRSPVKKYNILEKWIGVMGKGVRDVTKQAARETTEVAMKRNDEPPAQQFSNAILDHDFSFVEKNKGNLEILFGLWMK